MIIKEIRVSSFPNCPKAKGKKGGPGEGTIKVRMLKLLDCAGPIGGMKEV